MKTLRLVLVLGLLLAVGGGFGVARTDAATLLVVPSRYTVVQFAFDVLHARDSELMAYDVGAADEPLRLHHWDPRGRQWQPVAVDAYVSGSRFAAKPGTAVIVGDELPYEIERVRDWCPEVTHVPSLKLVDIANALDEQKAFTPAEWRWLAKRHRLELKDLNTARREQTRFDVSPEEAQALERARPNFFQRLFGRSWTEKPEKPKTEADPEPGPDSADKTGEPEAASAPAAAPEPEPDVSTEANDADDEVSATDDQDMDPADK